MNNMKEVAKLLNVELEQMFDTVECKDIVYQITEHGLFFQNSNKTWEKVCGNRLQELLTGKYTVKAIDKPKNRKEQFIKSFDDSLHIVEYIIVVVKLPNEAKEVIVNSACLRSKMEYYKSAYDDDLKLKTNPEISIVDWMIV